MINDSAGYTVGNPLPSRVLGIFPIRYKARKVSRPYNYRGAAA